MIFFMLKIICNSFKNLAIFCQQPSKNTQFTRMKFCCVFVNQVVKLALTQAPLILDKHKHKTKIISPIHILKKSNI